jgi:hypothetical protein
VKSVGYSGLTVADLLHTDLFSMVYPKPLPGRWFRLAVVAAAAVAALALVPSTSEATSFTLASYDVTLRDEDPGLVLWDSDGLTTPYTFDLTYVGQTFTPDDPLFTVGTNEVALNLDDWTRYDISVSLAFSSPSGFGGSVEGVSGAAWLFQDFGYLDWDGPVVMSFGTTGLLQVALSDVTFGLPGGAGVNATFKLLREDSAVAVAEPASALLLGVGFLAVSLRGRRRQA